MRNPIAVILSLMLISMTALTVVTIMTPRSALAITPEEMLADPALESRARALSQQLRCLVCQNQSIDDSDAELAQDLRREVRSQLLIGASDDAILENVRGKYGDYVLLRPPVTTATYALWLSPIAILLVGAGLMLSAWRNRKNRDAPITGAPGANEDGASKSSDAAIDDLALADEAIAPPKSRPTDRLMMLAIAALILGGSLALYLMLGRADLKDQPLANRQAEIAAATKAADNAQNAAQDTLTTARAKVVDAPDSVGNWLELAMAATAAGDSETEITALQQALRITDGDMAIKSMMAEALSRAADGQVTIPARELIAEVLSANPAEPRALFIAGLAAYQDEDYQKAVLIWQRLRAISTPDAPWFALLARNIEDAAAKGGIALADSTGPSREDIAAAAEMSAADQQAMIESMVAGLAEKLADNPQDGGGWLRLARAYDVLGRSNDAATAYINAGNALPNDADTLITALEYIASNTSGATMATAAQPLLDHLAAIDPNQLEWLFFAGHFARERGDGAMAAMHWNQLLDRLPADSPFSADLRAEIATLPQN